MASSLAARAAARQNMVPGPNQQQAAPAQQGFFDRNRGAIENIIGLGGEAAGMWNQYQQNQSGQERAALNSPEFAAKVAEFSKQGQAKGGILDQNKPEANQPSVNAQLSEVLKNLMDGKISQMGTRHGPSTPDALEEQAYATANQQTGNQPVPSYHKGTNFPWEQLGMAAINRLGGEPTFAESMTAEQAAARDPNWLRNRLVGLAPEVLEAGGRAIGRVAGGIAGGTAAGPAAPAGAYFGANAGGEMGAGGGRLVGSAIKRFGTVNAPQRYT